jgi:hypothetical protein
MRLWCNFSVVSCQWWLKDHMLRIYWSLYWRWHDKVLHIRTLDTGINPM